MAINKQLNLFCSIIVSLFACIYSFNVYAADDQMAIGKVSKIEGDAYALTDNDVRRSLKLGSDIFEKDKVYTQDKSLITIVFNDKTRFELGPNANLEASEYQYKQAESDSVAINVLKGAFRFVTGLVAKNKPESMKVGTAVATIGIRGTQVIGEADSTSATIILLEPEDNSRQSKIDVYNSYGQVTIDEPGFGTEIPDEFSPPSPPRRMAMNTINNLTRSMQQINRINMPRPIR
ncbi:MAG: FecR family protein [Pseudomonadota bacterium]